jgi:aminopeptidase 2
MMRLSKNVIPTHYELNLSLDLDGLTFEGSVIVHLDVLHDTTSVVLHSKDLEITSTKIVHLSGDLVQVAVPLQYNLGDQTVTIQLDEPFTACSRVQLHQSFRGTIKKHGRTPGLQWTSYKAADGEVKRVYSTECEPIGARCIFPCFDEPDFKATLSSTVTINKDLTCVSNMTVASSHLTTTGTLVSKQTAFNATPRTSTYLTCFVIGDFDFLESERLKFPVRLYAVRGAKIQCGSKMLDMAVEALARYERLFGLEYPLPKLDLVALPHAGALENWGCIVFGERFLLLDPETTAAKTWQMSAETLCHELAHQWFGNLVTMAWWDDLWLNEAFAEWAGFYIVDKMFPEWEYWLHFVAADPDPDAMAFYQGALDLDSTRASHPIYNSNASPDRMGELFDNITYMKGASLLRMLCQHLGTDVFINGVKDYLKRHVYANATTSDLWESLTASSGKDVKILMYGWTQEVGYPILTVSEDETAGTIEVEQHRHLQSVTVTPEEDETIYHVTLNMRTSNARGASLLLTERRKTYPADLNFYKINAGQIGLYRVAYLPSHLRRYGQQISVGKLAAEDCVGLISDTHALVSCSLGHPTKTTDLFDFLLSFRNEENFLVWRQIFSTFAKIKQAFVFSSPQTVTALRRFHRHLTLPHCPDKVWEIGPSSTIPDQNAKALFFSQAACYEPLNGLTAELLDAYMAGDAKAINPNIRKYVFQAVAQSHDVGRVSTAGAQE